MHRLRRHRVDVGRVHLVVLRALPAARPVVVAVVLEGGEDVGPGVVAEEVQRLLGRPEVGDRAAGRHHQELVADRQLGHRVGDDEDRAAVVGEAAQQLHDVAVHARVEAGGRLVQEDQRRLGEQLQGDGDALALAAGEGADLLVLVDVELELAQHLVDAGLALGARGVGGEAQLGRVLQGPLDGQLLVQDVVLRHESDALAQLGELLVEVPVVVEDVALVGGAVAGQRLEQRRLAGTGGADHRDQRLLGNAEGDVPQDLLAAVDRDGQVPGGEGDLTGVDELLEPVADDPERRVADADDVGRAELDRAALGDRMAVDERAVVRAEVADLQAAVGRGVELGVVAGDLEVGDDQVVLQGTADAHHTAYRELVERGRAAVAVVRRRPRAVARARLRGAPGGAVVLLLRNLWLLRLRRDGRGGLLRVAAGRLLSPAGARALGGVRLLLGPRLRGGDGGLGGGQGQPRPVGRVAQVDGRAGGELHAVHPLPLRERAVGAAVVLQHPTAAVEGDRAVPPGDPGVVEHDVPLRITAEGV